MLRRQRHFWRCAGSRPILQRGSFSAGVLHPLALDQAREADAAVRRGEVLGPLHGVPIVIGKGNTPPLAMDMQTDNPVFGSDLAGSLRIPTAYCGIYGLKTSFGAVSTCGSAP